LFVEDQISEGEIRQAFEADAGRRPGGPALELVSLAQTASDALDQLRALGDSPDGLPDAIVIDDYLPSHGAEAEPQALELMRSIAALVGDLPRPRWPRTVLWSTCEPNLVYAFCALGGMQYQDKRHVGGRQVPVAAIWRALAGRRWAPEPYPTEDKLSSSQIDALPYIAAGLGEDAIRLRLGLETRRPLQDFVRAVNSRPMTPKEGENVPANKVMAAHELARQGWVWVPYRYLVNDAWPARAWVLPVVIDPMTHGELLPAVGDVPREHAARMLA